jgi:hypothetical protein
MPMMKQRKSTYPGEYMRAAINAGLDGVLEAVRQYHQSQIRRDAASVHKPSFAKEH